MTQTIYQYSYLQVLDFLTTIAFLLNGVQEGNPLVRYAMNVSGSPLLGLFLVKTAAIVLGLYCWQNSKGSLLTKINIGFALLVTWNLVSLIMNLVK